MSDREKIIKALSICAPETQDDSKLKCSDCPYGDVCNPNDIVGITLPLIWDIRALLKEQEAVKPKTGHWIETKCLDECFWVCSKCHFPSEAIVAPKLYKYCPNCGTKMEEQAVK